MKETIFDVFSETLESGPLWRESVKGLSNARERMEQIASEEPGHYFLFSVQDHVILARIETFKKPEAPKDKTAQS
jgi:hypothetical protein